MKHLSIIRYALLGISALLVLVWVFFMPQDDVDLMLYWCYLLMGIAVLLLIILPTVNMVKNPKGAMRSLIGLAIVAVLVVAGYSLGSDAPVAKADGTFFDNPTVLKLSDAGIYLTYVAMAVTIIVAVFGEIRNAFK